MQASVESALPYSVDKLGSYVSDLERWSSLVDSNQGLLGKMQFLAGDRALEAMDLRLKHKLSKQLSLYQRRVIGFWGGRSIPKGRQLVYQRLDDLTARLQSSQSGDPFYRQFRQYLRTEDAKVKKEFREFVLWLGRIPKTPQQRDEHFVKALQSGDFLQVGLLAAIGGVDIHQSRLYAVGGEHSAAVPSIVAAVSSDNPQTVETLVALGADLSHGEANPLVHAARQDFLSKRADIIRELGKGDIPQKIKDEALFTAIEHYHREAIEPLLDIGAHVHAVNKSGASPLVAAAGKGDLDMVKMIIQRGGDVNCVKPRPSEQRRCGNALGEAIYRGYWDVVDHLLPKVSLKTLATCYADPRGSLRSRQRHSRSLPRFLRRLFGAAVDHSDFRPWYQANFTQFHKESVDERQNRLVHAVLDRNTVLTKLYLFLGADPDIAADAILDSGSPRDVEMSQLLLDFGAPIKRYER